MTKYRIDFASFLGAFVNRRFFFAKQICSLLLRGKRFLVLAKLQELVGEVVE
jgi:hypothetical protein